MIAESSHGAFRWDGDTALYVSKEYKRIARLYIAFSPTVAVQAYLPAGAFSIKITPLV